MLREMLDLPSAVSCPFCSRLPVKVLSEKKKQKCVNTQQIDTVV